MSSTHQKKVSTKKSSGSTEDDRRERTQPEQSVASADPDTAAIGDLPASEPMLLPTDPAEAAAYVLVDRMLETSPGARELARREGVAVVVEVPSGEWVDPVAEAWRMLVRRSEDVPEDGDDAPRQRTFDNNAHVAWFEFRRQGNTARKPSEGNGKVHFALRTGRSIYGFSPSPERYLPSDLIRVADLRLTLPPMDAAALAETIKIITGELPIAQVAPLLVTPTIDDLCLARRPNQTADEYLAKILALTQQRMSAPSLTLASLHGMDEAVRWGHDLARDLGDYRRGILPWSAVDRGVLLYGPPGTGKTIFAQALAATCGVPLIAASLSQWQAAGHLGDLLKAMRRSFAEARAAAPSLLFVDEVDSFGDRDDFTQEHRNYATQVVNGFLEELDGITARAGVVVIGACNRPERLDAAILRSGRLDRIIGIPFPNAQALAGILRYHLGADLPDADLSEAALLALGGTGADCERWVRGARRRARYRQHAMTIEDLTAEIRGTRRERSPEALRRCAVHEAGHALVTVLERPPGSLLKVSIQQSDGSGGSVMSTGFDDLIATRAELEIALRQLLAGRAAEEVILGEPSSGAGGDKDSDLARATTFAASIVCSWGLDDEKEGLVWTAMPKAESVGEILVQRPDVAKRVAAMLAGSYERVRNLILSHRSLIERIADLLLKDGTIDGKEIEDLARATTTSTMSLPASSPSRNRLPSD